MRRPPQIIAQTGTISVTIALLAVLLLTGCGLLPTSSNSAGLTQGNGLPTLRHLDWGSHSFYHPVWSPDGHWIAVLVESEDDYTTSHLEVVSPDGKTKYDLSSWRCGEGPDPDYAWMPDDRLVCVNGSGDTTRGAMCIGAAPFDSCTRKYLAARLVGEQHGLAWTADGRSLLYPAELYTQLQGSSDLYVLSEEGALRQVIPFSSYYDIAFPSFRPQAATMELAYYLGTHLDATTKLVDYDLVISDASQDATGKLTLGSARTVLTNQFAGAGPCAWSPSGHWLVANKRGSVAAGVNDKIILINPDDPSQTVDVVQTKQVGRTYDPIWSPDGKTLIIVGLLGGFGSQPYAIDIASYLASKGLQP
jgi:hypothetical protein